MHVVVETERENKGIIMMLRLIEQYIEFVERSTNYLVLYNLHLHIA